MHAVLARAQNPIYAYQRIASFMSLKTTFSLVTLFAVSEVMVVLASIYGPFLLGYSDHADLTVDTLVSSVCRCDAIRYVTIAKEGYDYEIGRVSTIGYLP